MNIPTEEQINAILQGEVGALAIRYAGGDLDVLDHMWTVSAVDVVGEALARGVPSSWVHWESGSEDGLYIVPNGSTWRLQMQERGSVLWQSDNKTKEDATEAAVRLFLLPMPLRT
jgi:hypothetical protein